MKIMESTPERSGASAALYVMLTAPSNAPSIVVQAMFPHRSIDCSLAAFAASPLSLIWVKFPDMLTVWLPASAYAWVASVTCVVELPSPQCTV